MVPAARSSTKLRHQASTVTCHVGVKGPHLLRECWAVTQDPTPFKTSSYRSVGQKSVGTSPGTSLGWHNTVLITGYHNSTMDRGSPVQGDNRLALCSQEEGVTQLKHLADNEQQHPAAYGC